MNFNLFTFYLGINFFSSLFNLKFLDIHGFLLERMKNSASDHSFYIESEEEDEEKAFHNNEGEDDRHELDSSDGEHAAPQRQPSSYSTQWPQSYRFTLYVSVFLLLKLSFCYASLFTFMSFLGCWVSYYSRFHGFHGERTNYRINLKF